MPKKIAKQNRLIISVFDYTEGWVSPYKKAGYPVICWDKKIEGCILENFSWLMNTIDEAKDNGYLPYGFLFAPPCDDYAVSGSRWWKEKDQRVTVEYAPHVNSVDLHDALVQICLHIVDLYKDTIHFWALENPVGRIEKRNPELIPYRKMIFHPFQYGDAYTKKTILWGNFNTGLKQNEVKPVMYELGGKKGSYMWAKLGGKSERTKSLRSKTPTGFANAFFSANQ